MHFIPVVCLLLLIGAVLWLAETMAKSGRLNLVISRKLVHVVAVTAVAISPLFVYKPGLLAALIAFFVLLLFWAVAYNKLAIDKGRRKSWGIALFPLAFLVLYLAFGQSRPWLVVYPMLVLAWSDAAAAVAGETFARRFYYLTGDRKSFPGSLAFTFCTVLVLGMLPAVLPDIDPWFLLPTRNLDGTHWWLAVIFISIVAAAAEALGSGGFDNLLVPFVVAWLLHVLDSPGIIYQAWLALAMVGMVAWLSLRKGWLDAGGAVSAAMLGIIVWLAGKWSTALPILLFFVIGTLLGRLPRRNAMADEKQGQPRDFVQVICNGGIGGAMLIGYMFSGNALWLLLYIISIAVSAADTFSSEIGQWAGGRVIDIGRLKPVAAGVSGGVSWQGCLGGLAGAGLIAVAGRIVGVLGQEQAVFVAVAGFGGMLLDSLLGSWLQAGYRLEDGSLADYIPNGKTGNLVRGVDWVNNDTVNLLSNLLVCLLAAILLINMV